MRTSRFIISDDPRIDKVMLELPKHWWSRPYEYAWATSFASPEQTVLDAACGLSHPFKYHLCKLCKSVYACDINEHILCNRNILLDMFRYFGVEAFDFPMEYLGKPILSRQDISSTSYDDSMFDTVFCISVLEHLPAGEVLKTLLEFKRILKQDGLIVITFEYPPLDPETFNATMEQSGLVYADAAVFDLPETALTTSLFHQFDVGPYCFRALLKSN